MAYLDRKPNRTMQITAIAIVVVLEAAAVGGLWRGLDLSRVFAPSEHAQSRPAVDSPDAGAADALPAQPPASPEQRDPRPRGNPHN